LDDLLCGGEWFLCRREAILGGVPPGRDAVLTLGGSRGGSLERGHGLGASWGDVLGRVVSRVEHRKHLLFHEATFLGLLCENAFCLAPGMLTFTLSFPFELLVGGQAGRDGTAYAADERTDALCKAGREHGDGGVWGLRRMAPGGVVVVVVFVIRTILALYLARFWINFETRT